MYSKLLLLENGSRAVGLKKDALGSGFNGLSASFQPKNTSGAHSAPEGNKKRRLLLLLWLFYASTAL